jgi:hypothetical protein
MKRAFAVFTGMCLLLTDISLATVRRVLFIGNSYTFTNSMPTMLQSFAAAKGDTLIFDQSDPGGFTFKDHSTYSPTISLIFSRPWDIVVLQEQSQMPAFPPAEVDTEVYPYARMLDSMIRVNDTCTETMFLMTWGHANGDPMNCGSYPVICTYAGMQQRLRESYLQMASDNHAIVAPVGAAWKVMIDSFPSTWLFQADSSHPVVNGSYLEACVLYSSIFHKHAYGCSYLAGLSTGTAQLLQRIADKVTLDSLTNWQQHGYYPSAAFRYATAGTTVTFSNNSAIPSYHNWSFGDATGDTAATPTHTYSSNGNYVVTHTVSNNCFTETFRDTLHIGSTSVSQYIAKQLRVTNNASGVNITVPGQCEFTHLDIYDMQGRAIGRYELKSSGINVQLVPGIYIYKAYSSTASVTEIGRFGAY